MMEVPLQNHSHISIELIYDKNDLIYAKTLVHHRPFFPVSLWQVQVSTLSIHNNNKDMSLSAVSNLFKDLQMVSNPYRFDFDHQTSFLTKSD